MAESRKRTVEPRIEVSSDHVDRRREMVHLANEKEPEFVHSFKRGDVDAGELQVHQMEVVKTEDIYPDKKGTDEGSKPMKHRHDLLVRQPKELAAEQKRRGELISEKRVEKLMRSQRNLDAGKFNPNIRWERKPKSPSEVGRPPQ